jgi:predicted RNA-binding Zn ribbon-like protein
MSVDRGAEAWWQIESARAAQRSARDRALRRLRSALRDLIEALVDDHPVPKASVSELNFLMQSAPASTRLALIAAGLRAETHWHREFGGNPRLAFIATQAAEFLSDPSQVHRLRWCANPACSVVFIAVNPGGAGRSACSRAARPAPLIVLSLVTLCRSVICRSSAWAWCGPVSTRSLRRRSPMRSCRRGRCRRW